MAGSADPSAAAPSEVEREEETEHEMVPVGAISRPHGVKGAVRVHLFNDESDLLSRAKRWTLVRERPDGTSESRDVEVERTQRAAKYLIAQLKGVRGRDAADELRGFEVQLSREEFPELDDDEFYYVDIIGLPVFVGEQERGKVEDVASYPSIDCLVVRSPDGVREIPIVPPWLEDISLDEGWVRVGSWDDLPVQKR